MTETEIIYSASDVYKRLGVKDSTLRKYVEVLQREGYHFNKDKQGRRRYQEHDVMALEKLMKFSKHDGMTLGKAARAIAQQLNRVERKNSTEDEKDSFSIMQQYDGMLNQIINEQKKQLVEMEERLNKSIVQNTGTISESLKKMESKGEEQIKNRDDLLMKTYREQHENKKLLLEIQKELAATKESKKWWQFWK